MIQTKTREEIDAFDRELAGDESAPAARDAAENRQGIGVLRQIGQMPRAGRAAGR